MIERVVSQVRGARLLAGVVVATSDDSSDDKFALHLQRVGIPVVRGPLEDVLGRFVLAAQARRAETIVRITADCPLHSPDTIDEVVSAFLRADVDYATNTEPYTRPDGTDVEVFSWDALVQADRHARVASDREHVTPWLRRANGIRRLSVRHKGSPGGHLRWTVDEPSDLDYVRTVWAALDNIGPGPHCYERIMSVVSQIGILPVEEMPNRGYYKSLYDEANGQKAPALRLTASEAMLERSGRVIPGGAQTYSKSWRQHIRGVTPLFLERGAGARVWDVDGNEYIDLIQGLLPNILGYAHPEVDRAAYERARRGHSFSLAHPLEVELAERLVKMFPCAEMIRFGKNGSDATAGAVRAARAYTGREHVATCGYHGWQDWFIGTTTRFAGVPRSVRELAHPFPYNDLEALRTLLDVHPGEFATVIMEPFNFVWPAEGYLSAVKELAHEHGALLIFDEICTGFHLGLGGAQTLFGVVPDMATFGKAMGNGYAISCIAGRRDIMKIFDDIFVSFTFAGDVSAMAASLAVLDILEHTDALARLTEAASRLRDGAIAFAHEAGLEGRFHIWGHPNWALLKFTDLSGADDPLLRAIWLQEVHRRGVLILATHNTCTALDPEAVDQVLRAYAGAFKRVGQLLASGIDLRSELDGPIPTPAFRARG